MSTEENKASTRRFAEEVLNKKNYSLVDEFIDNNHVQHTTIGDFNGIEGMKQFLTIFFTAFPDLHTTIEDMIAEGDNVVTRQTVTGTHQGELMGIPPTGKTINVQQIIIGRFAGSKIVESWGVADMLGVMQQLGVVPSQ